MLLFRMVSCGVLIAACWSRPQARDISKGVDWLTRYGYLPAPDPLTAQQQTLEALTTAIKTMQRFAGLKETGILDDNTIEMMQRPRCSLPDIIGTSELMRRRKKRYALSGTVWSKNRLTWKVHSFPQTSSLSPDLIRELIQYALNVWSNYTQITFHEASADADILIDFSRSHHEDGYPFDGIGGTLAHAFFPGEHPISGDTHFDDDEIWTYNSPESDGTDLFAVAVHEFGHALGLAHSSAEDSIMKPYYQGPVGNLVHYKLPQDDIYGIEQLYGRRKVITGEEKPVLPVPNQPKIPYTPPQRPTSHIPRPDLPDRCKAHFNAIANIRGEVFFFKNRYFWRLQPSRNLVSLNPARIHRFWQGLPDDLDRVDAVYERTNDSKIVFFRGHNYWVFKDTTVEPGYPRSLRDFGLLPNVGIDAAFVWQHNGKTYFFQGSKFWRFDEHASRMDPGYPKEVNMWQGVPQDVDDIVSWNDGDTYFFKGTKYWKFTGGKVEADSGFPRSVAHDWMYCDMTSEGLPTQQPKLKGESACTCVRDGASVVLPNGSFFYIFILFMGWSMSPHLLLRITVHNKKRCINAGAH
ncbi:matrix metalloproteinase-25 [Rhinatrema bivittatum]|uniref:matrix metalloproteinase-25 n=1 Tax=Rhinatrema bivittatum TaxID=194408 RepID=UPI001125E557|nr:matrix metalloproteinase-25 [Rhinatrema bivittatum]